MKIDISIFKKTYAWSAMSAIMFIIMLVMWLCGTELTKITTFCILTGAIFGNFNAAIAHYQIEKNENENPIAEIETSLTEIIEEIRDED